MKTKWFTIVTRQGFEISVSKALTRKKIETYCPLKQEAISSQGILKTGNIPVFTSYVFLNVKEDKLDQLRRIHGVLNLLYCLDKPVVLEDAEISTIRQFIERHINITIDKVRLGSKSTGSENKSFLTGIEQSVLIQSLSCKLSGEVPSGVVITRPSYPVKLLKIGPQYVIKNFR